MYAKRIVINNKKDYDQLYGLILSGYNFKALDKFGSNDIDEKKQILHLAEKYNFNPRTNIKFLNGFDEQKRKAIMDME